VSHPFWSRHHEADVSAEQPKTQEDARLPGSHAHQGWSPGPEETPTEGAPARLAVKAEALPDTGLRSAERIRRAADFRGIFRKGIRLDGRLFTLLAGENASDICRLGLATSRRVGGAVERNRAKRLLRETFRRNKNEALRGLDLVLVPKREIVGLGLSEVEAEYRLRVARLLRRRAR